MNIEELFADGVDKEQISAFAFRTGMLIEHIINSRSNNLIEENEHIRNRIMTFRSKIGDSKIRKAYDEHFGIGIVKGFEIVDID